MHTRFTANGTKVWLSLQRGTRAGNVAKKTVVSLFLPKSVITIKDTESPFRAATIALFYLNDCDHSILETVEDWSGCTTKVKNL